MQKRHLRHWPTVQATLGLATTGAGLCLAIDSAMVRASGGSWLLYGTAALAIFNSGLCLTIDAGLKKMKRQLKK